MPFLGSLYAGNNILGSILGSLYFAKLLLCGFGFSAEEASACSPTSQSLMLSDDLQVCRRLTALIRLMSRPGNPSRLQTLFVEHDFNHNCACPLTLRDLRSLCATKRHYLAAWEAQSALHKQALETMETFLELRMRIPCRA